MSQIYEPPNDYDFGLEFNYAVWTPNTTIRFANVPWNSDYRDVVGFESQTELDTYIANQNGPVITHMSYSKPTEPVYVDIPFNRAYKWNYLAVSNPRQPIPGNDEPRTFYYFINDVRYIAPNTTELVVMLDVWQTFIRNVNISRCYVERSHLGIANSKQMDNSGRDYLTIPEGLDLGSEYAIGRTWARTIAGTSDVGVEISPTVLILSSIKLDSSFGTVENPNIETAEGGTFEGYPQGASVYYLPISEMGKFMRYLSTRPWVSQGIISMQLVPLPSVPNTRTVRLGNDIGNTSVDLRIAESKPNATEFNIVGRFREYLLADYGSWLDEGEPAFNPMRERYGHLNKFKTYPYSAVELTTFQGNSIILHPELIDGEQINLTRWTTMSPPNARLTFIVNNYNRAYQNSHMSEGPDGSFADMQIGFYNFPQISIVNDQYLLFMANNANALKWQKESASWSQQRAIQGAQVGYDNSRLGINNMQTQNSIAVNSMGQTLGNQLSHNRDRMYLSAGQSLVGGVVGGAMSGGIAGAGAGLIGGAINAGGAVIGNAIDAGQMNAQYGIDSARMNASNSANVNATAGIAQNNKGLAEWAARGDYANQIAGINAKVQDAEMNPPSMAGQFGGDLQILMHYKWAVVSRIRRLQEGVQRNIGEFWLRYGYAIQRFYNVNNKFHVMTHFTYWKMLETYISSSDCPEVYKQTIRGILEKGVTVWKNPLDIGVIDPAINRPLPNISY